MGSQARVIARRGPWAPRNCPYDTVRSDQSTELKSQNLLHLYKSAPATLICPFAHSFSPQTKAGVKKRVSLSLSTLSLDATVRGAAFSATGATDGSPPMQFAAEFDVPISGDIEASSGGRFMAYSPSPSTSPHVSGLRSSSSALSEQEK